MKPERIIEYIKAYEINTKISPDGYCYGLASMARDAFLLGPKEYQRYQTRLLSMNKNDFLAQMKDFIQQTHLLTKRNINLNTIYTEKLNQWPLLIKYAATSLEKPETEINAKDLYGVYLEIGAFLQTMTILQAPNFHKNLFATKKSIAQHDNATTLPLMANYLAEKQGGTVKIGQIIGIYSHESMIKYLNSISNTAIEKPFAIMLSNGVHAVALLYDRTKKQWILDNHGEKSIHGYSPFYYPNGYSKANEQQELNELAQELNNILSKGKENYTLSTSLYSLGCDKDEVTRAFSTLQHDEKTRLEKQVNNELYAEKISDLLYLASRDRNNDLLDTANSLVKYKNYDPNEKDKDGYTALHRAAISGHVGIVQTLLKHPKCNPNQPDKYGRTALQLAESQGHMNIVRILFKAILYLAVKIGHQNTVKALLKNPLCHHVNEKNDKGFSILHLAAYKGHTGIVQALLEHGYNPNIQEKYGHTPLLIAAENGHAGVVQYLLQHPNCNPNEEQDEHGYNALHLAAENGHLDVVQALLTYRDCNPNKEDKNGYSALHMAVENGHLGVVQALLKHDKINLDQKDKNVGTPLQIAIEDGHLAIIQALVEKGSKVDNIIINIAKHQASVNKYTDSMATYTYLLEHLQPIASKRSSAKHCSFFKPHAYEQTMKVAPSESRVVRPATPPMRGM